MTCQYKKTKSSGSGHASPAHYPPKNDTHLLIVYRQYPITSTPYFNVLITYFVFKVSPVMC